MSLELAKHVMQIQSDVRESMHSRKPAKHEWP
jgi:hypothetical protein